MSITKILKSQAGKPFKVIENNSVAASGFTHTDYRVTGPSKVSVPPPKPAPRAKQHVDQHVGKRNTSDTALTVLLEPGLAVAMEQGFQSVVEALQGTARQPATLVPSPTPEAKVSQPSNVIGVRTKKHRVNILSRDEDGNIESIELQEY